MADSRLTDLSSATPATGDLLYLVDVSDPTEHPAGSSRKATVGDVLALAPPVRFAATVQGGFFSVAAGETVRVNGDGTVFPGSPSNAAGIALTSAGPGGAVTVQAAGVVTVAGWGLTPGATYYADPVGLGVITATQPTAGQDVRRIGVALTATTLALDIGPYIPADRGLMAAGGGVAARRQFGGYFPSPAGTVPITGAGAFGTFNLSKLRAKTESLTLTVAVLLNGTPVPGWGAVAVTTTSTETAPTAPPVVLADGGVLAVQVVSGAGTGLSFAFSE